MNAKEMFEKLGLEKTETSDFIYFEGKQALVIFGKKWKSYSSCNEFGTGKIIDLRHHQAIHQQMKELGWLE